MSFLSKTFPWLFIDVTDAPASAWKDRLTRASSQEKKGLINDKGTPARALSMMAQDPDTDVRRVLTERLANILPTLSPTEQVEVYDLTISAIRALAEDQVTAVRVALASALKDIAKAPHDVARKLADDAERAVAEPILRYSLSLSDQDLLELIAQHPTDWHPEAIAQRKRITEHVSEAIAKTDNLDAGKALLRNDGAYLNQATRLYFGRNPEYRHELAVRETLSRKMRREWFTVTDQILVQFLREKVELDQSTTANVMTQVHQHMSAQGSIKDKPARELNADEIQNALRLGENNLVIEALAFRGEIPVTAVRRMIDAGNGRAVIALCTKCDMPMSFAILAQSKLARLPPEKMLYPKDGDKNPLSPEDLKWQWDFFGL